MARPKPAMTRHAVGTSAVVAAAGGCSAGAAGAGGGAGASSFDDAEHAASKTGATSARREWDRMLLAIATRCAAQTSLIYAETTTAPARAGAGQTTITEIVTARDQGRASSMSARPTRA